MSAPAVWVTTTIRVPTRCAACHCLTHRLPYATHYLHAARPTRPAPLGHCLHTHRYTHDGRWVSVMMMLMMGGILFRIPMFSNVETADVSRVFRRVARILRVLRIRVEAVVIFFAHACVTVPATATAAMSGNDDIVCARAHMLMIVVMIFVR